MLKFDTTINPDCYYQDDEQYYYNDLKKVLHVLQAYKFSHDKDFTFFKAKLYAKDLYVDLENDIDQAKYNYNNIIDNNNKVNQQINELHQIIKNQSNITEIENHYINDFNKTMKNYTNNLQAVLTMLNHYILLLKKYFSVLDIIMKHDKDNLS